MCSSLSRRLIVVSLEVKMADCSYPQFKPINLNFMLRRRKKQAFSGNCFIHKIWNFLLLHQFISSIIFIMPITDSEPSLEKFCRRNVLENPTRDWRWLLVSHGNWWLPVIRSLGSFINQRYFSLITVTNLELILLLSKMAS